MLTNLQIPPRKPRRHARALCAATLMTLVLSTGCDRTPAEWEAVMQAPTLERLREFRHKHPNSEFDATAAAKIVELEWDEVKDATAANDIERFMEQNPGSPFQAVAEQTHERLLWTEALKEKSIAAYRRVLARYPQNERTPPLVVDCCTEWTQPDPAMPEAARSAAPQYISDYEHSGLTQRPGPGGVGWVTDYSKGPGTVKGTLTSRIGPKSYTARFGKVVFAQHGLAGPSGLGLCLTDGQVVLQRSDMNGEWAIGADGTSFEVTAIGPETILATLRPDKNQMLCLSAETGRFLIPKGARVTTPEAHFIGQTKGWEYSPDGTP